jgi:hypothetical protein
VKKITKINLLVLKNLSKEGSNHKNRLLKKVIKSKKRVKVKKKPRQQKMKLNCQESIMISL